MTKSNISFLVEGISADIARYIAEDEGATVTEALGILYNSTTFEKLSNPATGLYLNSSAYVYELLKKELREGKWPALCPADSREDHSDEEIRNKAIQAVARMRAATADSGMSEMTLDEINAIIDDVRNKG